jgi:hypothetical protein
VVCGGGGRCAHRRRQGPAPTRRRHGAVRRRGDASRPVQAVEQQLLVRVQGGVVCPLACGVGHCHGGSAEVACGRRQLATIAMPRRDAVLRAPHVDRVWPCPVPEAWHWGGGHGVDAGHGQWQWAAWSLVQAASRLFQTRCAHRSHVILSGQHRHGAAAAVAAGAWHASNSKWHAARGDEPPALSTVTLASCAGRWVGLLAEVQVVQGWVQVRDGARWACQPLHGRGRQRGARLGLHEAQRSCRRLGRQLAITGGHGHGCIVWWWGGSGSGRRGDRSDLEGAGNAAAPGAQVQCGAPLAATGCQAVAAGAAVVATWCNVWQRVLGL